MKAAVCYAYDKPLVIEEIDIDPPQTGEVKVRVVACAICHSDVHQIRGDWSAPLPLVAGHEAAGVVEEVGPGVTNVKVGDHVVMSLLRSCGRCYYCAKGDTHLCEGEFALAKETRLHNKKGEPIAQSIKTAAFAEYAVVDQSQLVPIPKEIPLDSASLLACGVITGLGAVVNTAKVGTGETVAVIGLGGVGLSAIQGASLSGAHPIIALDLLDSKLEAAGEFGATHFINAATAEDPVAAVQALTGGRGVDYAFVTVGSPIAVAQAITLIRRGGSLVLVGIPDDKATHPLLLAQTVWKEQRVLSSSMGSTRLSVQVPQLIQLYQHGRLKLDELISRRYPLEEINEAIANMEKGEALRNVIVF
ncbi:MAG: Zn-dependent alcohol dehydrogenase [Caldilineaceae bacterium]|nr:Zn-dependent alcohol dehydrogenase [Caldilineaceae bacterium]